MLSGLQQLSPMPCHSTTGVGSDEKYYGDDDKNTITNTVMLIMMMVMLIYGDRERESYSDSSTNLARVRSGRNIIMLVPLTH